MAVRVIKLFGAKPQMSKSLEAHGTWLLLTAVLMTIHATGAPYIRPVRLTISGVISRVDIRFYTGAIFMDPINVLL